MTELGAPIGEECQNPIGEMILKPIMILLGEACAAAVAPPAVIPAAKHSTATLRRPVFLTLRIDIAGPFID